MRSAPLKRHSVDIMRPPAIADAAYDARGQLSGSAKVVAKDVPCSIDQLQGRELELARQNMAQASLRIRLFGDPEWNLTTGDYLLRESDSTRIDIGHIRDPNETDLEYTLTCSEEAASI